MGFEWLENNPERLPLFFEIQQLEVYSGIQRTLVDN